MAEKPEDSSTDEIEVTPEMVEAGVRVYALSSKRWDLDETSVCGIFAAMVAASPELKSRVVRHDWGVIEGV